MKLSRIKDLRFQTFQQFTTETELLKANVIRDYEFLVHTMHHICLQTISFYEKFN